MHSTQKPLRVALAAPHPRHPGGIVSVISAWRDAGLGERVELVELPTSAWDDPLPRQLAQALRALVRLALLAARRRVDVVHLHASVGGSVYRKLALSWVCRLGAVPYLAHEHSGSFTGWLAGSRLRRRLARSLFANAAACVVLAEVWRPAVESLGARRVAVIPNGLAAAERARLERCRASRPARPANHPRRLLFYGRWAPLKGPDRIADALRALGRDDLSLHVYGNGDEAWLRACFEGVPGEVEIGGWLEGKVKLEELSGADALLAPSRAEGLPTALIEARAAGTPVIATAVGAVSEALDGYRPALLLRDGDDAALRDAIAAVLDGCWPPEGATPGPFPRRLTAEDACERLLEVYEEVAPGP
jgi:glycosyltransferase involved in cell wall biosynthesis